jgi:hypothetical protein
MVRVNENNVLKSRTHFDLLQTPHEKELVKYHAHGPARPDQRQLARREEGRASRA